MQFGPFAAKVRVKAAFVAALSEHREHAEGIEKSSGDEQAKFHCFPLFFPSPRLGVGLVEDRLAALLAEDFFEDEEVVSPAAAAIERGWAAGCFFEDLVLEMILSFGAGVATVVLPRNA